MSTDSTLSLEELVQRAAGLRERAGALGQKDPLSEYRLEGHTMFDEMMNTVKSEFVRYMFHIQVDRPPEAEEQKVADADYSY